MKIYPHNTTEGSKDDDGSKGMTRLEINMERVAIAVIFLSVFGFFFKIVFF